MATGVTPKALKTLPIPPPFGSAGSPGQVLVNLGREILQAPVAERPELAGGYQPQMDAAVVALGELDVDTYQPQLQPRRRRRTAQVDDGTGQLF